MATHKIITYNVNGIRAAIKKGLIDWLQASAPDILCLQELKATEDQIDIELFTNLGYDCYWYPAEKKGYSGVGILSKHKPKHVEYGCALEDYDKEGRVIRLDFEPYSVLSTYFPSGTTGDVRQDFKYRFLDDFFAYIQELRKTNKNLIVSGDFNICHQPIDIHNPVSNKNSSGFLPDERAWVDKFLKSGFIDTFREFNQEPHHYTWWSYRANARANNKGWRIDYNMATQEMQPLLRSSKILPEAKHSDHCPVLLEIGLN